MTRKGVGILAGIIVVLSGALVASPALIDWTRFKDDLAVKMEGALGRRLSIDGKVSFSFLPAPSFAAEGVHLSGGDGTDGDMVVSLPKMEIRPRLLPLLTGRLEIASLVLVSPDIRLTRPPRSPLMAPVDAPVSPGVPGAPVVQAPSEVSAPRSAPIDRITIENGSITYLPPGRAPWRFEKVGASVIAQSGGGGRLVGSARLAGLDIGFDGVQGSASGGQPVPVNFTVTSAAGAGALRLGGQMSGSGAERRFAGKLSFKAGDLSRIAAALAGGDGIALPLGNVGLEAAVKGSAREIDLDGLIVTLGGVEGTGNASLSLDETPQADVKLAFGRFDLDSLLAGLRNAGAGGIGGTSSSSPPSSPPVEPARAAGIVLPGGFSATVDLGAEVTVFHGGLLRGVHVNAALVNGEVTINQASLSLPGNSEVNLFGFLVSPDGVPSFEGSFEAASDDLRGLLDWLKVDTKTVPADRLHGARLASKLRVRPGEIVLDGTQIRLDGARIDAAAMIRLGERPAVGASFAVDSLNLDAYWPSLRQDPPAASGGDGQTTGAPVSATLPDLSWLGQMDANVKGRIGQMTVRGTTVREVSVDGAWQGGRLTVADLSAADVAGADMHLDGAVDGLAEGNPVLHAVHYGLRSKQPDHLIRQLGLPGPVDAGRLGSVALSGTLDGGLDGLSIDSRNEVAGGVVSLSGKIAQPLLSPHFDGTVEITHGNALQVIGLFAPAYRPSGNLGGLSVNARAGIDAGGAQLSDLRLKAGPLAVSGNIRLALAGKPRIEAALSAGDIPLDVLLPSSRPERRALPAPPAPKEEPRHGVPAVATDKVSAAPRAVVASGAIPDRWSRNPSDLSWLNSVDGTIKIDAKSLSFGRNRINGFSIGLDLANATLSLQRLGGQLYGGDLSGGGRLSADGKLALQVALAHAQARDALLGVADIDVAEGGLDADVALNTSGLSSAEWIGRLAGSGKFSIRDGVIRGFDLKAVDDRLRALDGPAGLLALLQAGLTGGQSHFSSLSGSFHAGNGLIATDDVRLIADGGGANASAQINLPAYVMDARAEFHLASAPSGPPLTMRLSGPLDGPRRFVDINEIQQWLVSRGKAVKPKDVVKGLLKSFGR
ncbi:AsmA family protein [Telmatospirillum siberiense]|uniref:AsmA family protein n=1 Tax=Telmatospirillum siberiense TaxID=382514 RepID=UPI0013041626|nr:AsmA family protein [Telmatospirillum siberiense]